VVPAILEIGVSFLISGLVVLSRYVNFQDKKVNVVAG